MIKHIVFRCFTELLCIDGVGIKSFCHFISDICFLPVRNKDVDQRLHFPHIDSTIPLGPKLQAIWCG